MNTQNKATGKLILEGEIMTDRELNLAIAEEVMGWKRTGKKDSTKPMHRQSQDYPGEILSDWDAKGPHDRLEQPDTKGPGDFFSSHSKAIFFCGCEDTGELSDWATDMGAVCEVWEKIKVSREDIHDRFVWQIVLAAYDGVWTAAQIGEMRGHYTKAMMRIICPSPTTICLAALEAVKVPT